MKNIFTLIDYKTLLKLNIVSIFITGMCEAFAIAILLTKGNNYGTGSSKYKLILAGVIVISVLFIISLASLVIFIRMKNKK